MTESLILDGHKLAWHKDRVDAWLRGKMCGSLGLQHKVNECLWSLKHKGAILEQSQRQPPMHLNFI